LYGEFCSAPRDQRALVVRNTVRNWFIAEQDIPEDYEDARHDVLPTVRTRSYIEFTLLQMSGEGSAALSWPHQVLAEHLAIGLVYDLPQAMRTISQDDLDVWQTTFYEALEAARDNLAQMPGQLFVGLAERVYMSATGDNYDASRMILLDPIRQLEVRGECVAMVPNRDTLLIAGSEDPAGLALMANLAQEALKKPRPMTSLAFRLDGDQWSPWLPEPDSELFARFKLLEVQSMALEYNEQKELLTAQYHKRNEAVFVATFNGVQNDKTQWASSYCVWTAGVPTLLPRTDSIALVRPQAAPVIVPWEVAANELPHLLTPLDMYPARFRVDDFPSADELQRLIKAAGL
jgi:uncharacterized protein YtpQ (UPF0354 family)